MRGYAKKQKRLQTKTHLFINQNIVHMYTIHHMLQFNEKWALLIIHHFPIWAVSVGTKASRALYEMQTKPNVINVFN